MSVGTLPYREIERVNKLVGFKVIRRCSVGRPPLDARTLRPTLAISQ